MNYIINTLTKIIVNMSTINIKDDTNVEDRQVTHGSVFLKIYNISINKNYVF